MKKNPIYRTVAALLSLTALLCLSAPWAGWAQDDATSGEKTTNEKVAVSDAQSQLVEAIKRLDELEWIQAGIRQTMNVGGRKFVATGRHLQGPGLRLRRELKVTIGKTSSSLLEVCDGDTLYMKQQIDEAIDLKQVTIKEVLEAIEQAGLTEEQRSGWLRELGLTGLAEYLRGIEQTHIFDRVEQGTWEGRAVLVFHGRWKPEIIEQYAEEVPSAAGEEEKEEEDDSPLAILLPEHIPDEVICYLGAENGIPYRLEFRKISVGGKTTELAVIELTNVVIGEPIDEQEFNYIAPSEAQDLTNQFLFRIEEMGLIASETLDDSLPQ